MHTTIVDVATVADDLRADNIRIVDCRYNLADVDAGREAYLAAHIPGAVYAHLSNDLSGPPVTDHGRHPLPTPEALRDTFARLGIGDATQVVAYDAVDGATAARLWWLLRYMGHDAVAVLNGGFQAWDAAGFETRGGEETAARACFSGEARRDWLVTADGVPQANRLVDSRDPARYRGESEPLDPVAGHIPGAVNHYYRRNVDDDGRLLSTEQVRERLMAALGGTPPEGAVFYCGSGVTACHNLLALEYAGLPAARLYAGSWSEWCADPSRPVATGAEP